MKHHTAFSMESQGKSALLIRTSRCCRFVYLNEFTGTCLSIHSIANSVAGLQVYGGLGSLSHDFEIWPIIFQGSGPIGSILFSFEKISLL